MGAKGATDTLTALTTLTGDGLAHVDVPRVRFGQTDRIPPDVFEVLVEELAAALVADFKGDSAATVGSPSGMNHGR